MGIILLTIKHCGDCQKKRPPLTGFSLYLRKDYYTEERLKEMGLNDRQIKVVIYIKEKGKITNKEYQELKKVSKPTSTRDLDGLVKNPF